MEIGKLVPGIKPALCRLQDLRLYQSLHEEVSLAIVLYMHKKFEVNRTKIKGGCPMVTKVAQLISNSEFLSTYIHMKLLGMSDEDY